jgi:hypothetical protein
VSTAASIVPGVIGFAVILALLVIAPRIRRREWVAFARRNWRRGGSIERHNKERGDK